MKTFLKYFFGLIILIPLLALFSVGLYKTVIGIIPIYKVYMWFGIGIGAYLILGLIFKKNREWLQTFSHELTHTIVGLFFFKKIHEFNANATGEGSIVSSGSGNMVISLTPYFLPIFTLFFLIIRTFVNEQSLPVFDVIIGFTFAFHLGCFISQTGSYQTDLQKHGLFLSYIFIFTFLIMNIAIVLLSIDVNLWIAFKNFFVNCWEDARWFINWIISLKH